MLMWREVQVFTFNGVLTWKFCRLNKQEKTAKHCGRVKGAKSPSNADWKCFSWASTYGELCYFQLRPNQHQPKWNCDTKLHLNSGFLVLFFFNLFVRKGEKKKQQKTWTTVKTAVWKIVYFWFCFQKLKLMNQIKNLMMRGVTRTWRRPLLSSLTVHFRLSTGYSGVILVWLAANWVH